MERRPTLADVAARAGVSTALVSIVMREAPGASAATRARVLAVADEIGYRPDVRAHCCAAAVAGCSAWCSVCSTPSTATWWAGSTRRRNGGVTSWR
jgi:hypothetical protein